MLVNMIPVHVVQMAVMKIVNMAVMANSRMPAVRAMLVDMVGMLPLGAGGHEIPSSAAIQMSLPFGGTARMGARRLMRPHSMVATHFSHGSCAGVNA
jgi:hypothetical protein